MNKETKDKLIDTLNALGFKNLQLYYSEGSDFFVLAGPYTDQPEQIDPKLFNYVVSEGVWPGE